MPSSFVLSAGDERRVIAQAALPWLTRLYARRAGVKSLRVTWAGAMGGGGVASGGGKGKLAPIFPAVPPDRACLAGRREKSTLR